MKQALLSGLLLSLCWMAQPEAAVVGQTVEYGVGEQQFKGYLAYDDAIQTPRPGILVVHEWWGHNAYARRRADMLAALGYVALAVDMYGDGKTATHPDDAGAFSSAVMRDLDEAQRRFVKAMQVLQQHPASDADQIAAIGYCFGGGVVLHMARLGLNLKGVASFHGSLGAKVPAVAGQVKAKVLVCNGAEDPFVTAEQIEAFKQEMQAAGVDYQFESYAGVKHSFTNPDADKFGQQFGLPLAYDAAADAQSWQQLQVFFDSIFETR